MIYSDTPKDGRFKVSGTGWLCLWLENSTCMGKWVPVMKLTDVQIANWRYMLEATK